MLGRVRRSTISSLEELELERPSSKFIKADSLSVYETTLLKLREGSRRDTSFPAESLVDGNICCITSGGSPKEEASINSPSEHVEDTISCQPTGSFREIQKSNFSLAYMFS
ncbi:putative GDP-mannose transporter GONST3-like isoform X1, partial [Capsicum annuum]